MYHLFCLYLFLLISVVGIILCHTHPTAAQTSAPTYIEITDLLDATSKQLGIKPTIDNLINAKVIDPSEKDYIANLSNVPRLVVWRILLPTYGIYPYPAAFYSTQDITSSTPVPSSIYLDAWATALDCGLAHSGDSPYQYMTVKEFRSLLETLESGSITVKAPSVDCPYLDPDITWSLETYRGRNSLIVAWSELPLAWREDFIESGWNIKFTLPEATQKQKDATLRNRTLGMTDYVQKTIFLDSNSPTVTFHEFGHFASYRTGWWDNYLQPYFDSESSNVGDILGNYALTSPREYIAEFIAYWLAFPDQRTLLHSLAPQTSEVVIEITEQYDPLLLSIAP